MALYDDDPRGVPRPGVPIDVVAARAALLPKANRPGVIGGVSAPATGIPALPTPAGGSLLRPDFFPPLSAIDLQVFGQGNVAGANANPVLLPGGSFTLPATNIGFLRSLTLTVAPNLAVQNVRWFLFVNGSPAPGWADLRAAAFAAAASSVNFGPDETRIIIPAGATVETFVQVLDANAYDISMSGHGWSMPESIWNSATAGMI